MRVAAVFSRRCLRRASRRRRCFAFRSEATAAFRRADAPIFCFAIASERRFCHFGTAFFHAKAAWRQRGDARAISRRGFIEPFDSCFSPAMFHIIFRAMLCFRHFRWLSD